MLSLLHLNFPAFLIFNVALSYFLVVFTRPLMGKLNFHGCLIVWFLFYLQKFHAHKNNMAYSKHCVILKLIFLPSPPAITNHMKS